MNQTIGKLKGFFSEGHQRTLQAKKNIVISAILKGGSVWVSLILVPLTIDYINPVQYGIWLTISSFIVWFSFFDIGLGNGLKNKIAEAIANNDKILVKEYISSTYLFLAIISFLIYLLFIVANYFINWATVLNAPSSLSYDLGIVALIIFSVFSVQFVLQLINVVCEATQNTRITALSGFISNLLSLLLIFLLIKTTTPSLVYLSFAISISPLIVLTVFSVVLFTGKFKEFRPSFEFVRLSRAKSLVQLGFKFFLIQIGLIFFYNSNNIIITQIDGPEAVTPYNIAFKYFGIITMVSGIIMVPFWSAFTDAHTRKDYNWIKETVLKLEKIAILLLLMVGGMLLSADFAFDLWLGDKVKIPFSITASLAMFTIINVFRTIYCFYLNGVGKIQLQLYLIITAGILNVPFAILLGSYLGAAGVILATTILCSICGIFEVIQYKKLVSNTATGIWAR